ncbi:MAG: hypothetical protein HDR87_09695 [Bacteroides sp.]|nr:hypothetical protein [Bacteroides sp.]
MNTKILLMAAMISLASAANAAVTKSRRHSEKGVTSILINEQADSASNVEKAFQHNVPTSPRENFLPRFAIIGKDRQFYLGIGAQFLGEAVFDWGDHMPSALEFIPSSITPRTPGNGAELDFAWQTSSIQLNFIAMPNTHNTIGLYFKGNFNATKGFKMSHLYAKYRGLTAGYTNSIFTDGAAMPFTIDDQGPNGYPKVSLMTAYWTQTFSHGFSGAIGIDAPTANFTESTSAKLVSQRIPAIPLYVQYAYNDADDHVRISGLIRPMQYRNLERNHNSTLLGLGIQLSGITRLVGPISFSYNAAYGQGIATYLQDTNGLGLDATPSATDGKLTMPRTLGLTAGLSFNISRKVSANLVYSHLTNWLGHNASPQPSTYRFGDYAAANIIYNINRFLRCGLEYDYGHTKHFNNSSLHTNRLQAQLALTF